MSVSERERTNPSTAAGLGAVVPGVPGSTTAAPGSRDEPRPPARRADTTPASVTAVPAPAVDDDRSTGRSAGRRTWHSRYFRRLLPLDVVTGFVAGLSGAVLRGNDPQFSGYLFAVPFVVIGWLLALAVCDAYDRRYVTDGAHQLRVVGRAGVGVIAAVAIVAYLLRILPARTYLLAVIFLLVTGAVVSRLMVTRWLMANRARGQLMQRTVVVGRADSVHHLVLALRAEPGQGLLPVAACSAGLAGQQLGGRTIDGVPVVGPPVAALEAVDLVDAEVVAVASHPDLAGPTLRRLAWALEDRGVEFIVAPGLLDVAGPRLSIRPSRHLSLLHVERPSAVRVHVVVKSVMDRIIAATLVIILAPLLGGIALAIRLSGPGPILFIQRRVGVRGESFGMLKFRTMVVDAEDRLAALLEASDGDGVRFKMRDDPRITRVGRALRRYSLDELPQLFNVLRGDMSLVGPRPPLPREVEQYERDAHARLRVKPGMTGLWQVSGRSDLSWEESLRLDLHYVDNWSPMGDLHILLRTVNAVFRASGAY